jgi:hypothetical protein
VQHRELLAIESNFVEIIGQSDIVEEDSAGKFIAVQPQNIITLTNK